MTTKPETQSRTRGQEGRAQSQPADRQAHDHKIETLDLVRVGTLTLVVLGSIFHLWPALDKIDVVAAVATIVGGYPIFKEAFEAVLERRMTMELSMTIALVAALSIGEAFTALVITLFVLIAELLEGLTVGRGCKAISDLLDLLPQRVVVRSAAGQEEIGLDALRVKDVVIVKPGARIPVDGLVLSGTTFVDQSAVTGESMPVEKFAGSRVFAGTINQSGFLEVEVAGIGADTEFGKIVQAVEEAEKSRAPIQKLADRLAGYLVYFALGSAALTFVVTHDVRSTISVIIVAGACGVAAGTPLAILGAIGQTARRGCIVKGGLYLEALGTLDTIVLDKTGTLTLGNPEVVDLCPCPGVSESAVLQAAATAEMRSEHPLAKAVLRRSASRGVVAPEPDRFEYLPGRGIRCQAGGARILVGNCALLTQEGISTTGVRESADPLTQVWVAQDDRLLGCIHIADAPRPEAAMAVQALRAMGHKMVLLTGDSRMVAQQIADQLGIEVMEAELLPADKEARIRQWVNDGRKVAMVGDGVNDAPALMQATVGVAMGAGADVTQEAADVVLLGNDLLKFAQTVEIARRARRIIMANFIGTLAVDTVGIALAAVGWLNPLLAALIHVSSELAFILNSARLLPDSGVSRSPDPALSPAPMPVPSGTR